MSGPPGGTGASGGDGIDLLGGKLTNAGDVTGGVTGFGVVGGSQIQDNGDIVAAGGTLTLQNAVSGSGSMTIDSGATLRAEGTLSGVLLAFSAGGNAQLTLGAPTQDIGLQQGFSSGDVIDLTNLQATSLQFNNGTLTLKNGSSTVDKLYFSGSYTTADFALTSDGHGGTDISFMASDKAELVQPPSDFMTGASPGHGTPIHGAAEPPLWERVMDIVHGEPPPWLTHW